MKLHENKEEFLDLILTVSREYHIVPALIEKDYINNTERLLIENIKYDNAIKSLKYIIDSKLF